jgi:hypothetical protein
MTPEECAERTTPAISGLAANFMLDGATYAKGAELGFGGIDFYAAGRAGVLGELDADQVAESFGFMEPGTIATWVDQAKGVMAPQDAAAAFVGCAHDWADQHLGDDVDWSRVAELLGKVADAAPVDGLPLFRAWRDAPEPAADRGAKALALHRFHVVRELRNEIHVGAVREAGLSPVEAVMVKSPAMAPMFGWSELPEVGDEHRSKHDQAERATNQRMAAAFAGLDEAERDELVQLCDAALASVR